jgi:hypothetical protein
MAVHRGILPAYHKALSVVLVSAVAWRAGVRQHSPGAFRTGIALGNLAEMDVGLA